MSTYDLSYTNIKPRNIYKGGWNDICTCDEDKVNPFCGFHGKYKNGYFKDRHESK